VIAGGYDP